MAKRKSYMTFREVTELYSVSKGRLSQLTKGYTDSRTKRRVEPKFVYGKHWVRASMIVERKSMGDMEVILPVLTEEGQRLAAELFGDKEGKT